MQDLRRARSSLEGWTILKANGGDLLECLPRVSLGFSEAVNVSSS